MSTVRTTTSHILGLRLALSCFVAGLLACSGDHDPTSRDGSAVLIADAGPDDDAESAEPEADADAQEDAALDAAPDDDADAAEDDADAEVDLDADDGPPEVPTTVGKPCQADADCTNMVYCDGVEVCVASICQRAPELPCSFVHPCIEAKQECECGKPDSDRDNDKARECGGKDCDDSRGDCSSKAHEICDADGLDEDCNAATFNWRSNGKDADGDNDRDGFVDMRCRNFDEDTGLTNRGTDCNDANPSVKPGNTEACNYVDDDCDGHLDELDDPRTNTTIDGALMVSFLPDLDGDLRGDKSATPVRACDFYQPRGYIMANPGDAVDCDDKNAKVYGGAPEVCDGVDNDCDGQVDTQDTDLAKPFLPATTLACTGGAWTVPQGGCPEDKTWCSGDPIEQGCTRDATRLSSCRACQTSCQFSCGRAGCDEIVQIATGDQHACALTREGRVACWGRGESGRLGNDSVGQTSVPTYVVGISDVKGIAAGAHHSCAIVGPDRALYCWGRNESGQLGNLDVADFSTTPVPVVGVGTDSRLLGVAQVAAGTQHTCAILTSGALICFGQTAGGLLGNGVTGAGRVLPQRVNRRVIPPGFPVALAQPVQDASLLAVGTEHSCVVTQSGTVDCWGTNAFGQLGQDPSTTPNGYSTPVGLSGASAIVAGAYHTCALAAGVPVCWGSDGNLQLGREETSDQTEAWKPKAAASLSGVKSLAAGAQFSCAISEGNAACWGSNQSSELGPAFDGTRTNVPVQLPLRSVVELQGGRDYACALNTGGIVSCWGNNNLGQLGNDSPDRTIRDPRQIHALKSSNP